MEFLTIKSSLLRYFVNPKNFKIIYDLVILGILFIIKYQLKIRNIIKATGLNDLNQFSSINEELTDFKMGIHPFLSFENRKKGNISINRLFSWSRLSLSFLKFYFKILRTSYILDTNIRDYSNENKFEILVMKLKKKMFFHLIWGLWI